MNSLLSFPLKRSGYAVLNRPMRCVLGLSVLVLMVPAVSAHHGWGGNEDEPITLSGTLSAPVSLSGPHANMKITDADGQEWDITLAPAPRTNRAGLNADVIPVGEEVTIVGQRNQNPSLYEVKTRRVTYNGTNYDVYPPQ